MKFNLPKFRKGYEVKVSSRPGIKWTILKINPYKDTYIYLCYTISLPETRESCSLTFGEHELSLFADGTIVETPDVHVT